jgi:integrase
MKNIRLPERVVRPYTPPEISRLIEACDASDIGLRDCAMVIALLDTGLRCSELVKLDLSDLDMNLLRMRVRFGKGNKQRVVPFAARCRESLDDYLEVRGDDPGPLFSASDNHRRLLPGKQLQPNGLKQMLRRLGRKAGVEKVHAHRFRHTFATWAIEHDAREIDVQYLLGHSTSDMVRRYSSTYRSEQAATRHHAFSPADRMII